MTVKINFTLYITIIREYVEVFSDNYDIQYLRWIVKTEH